MTWTLLIIPAVFIFCWAIVKVGADFDSIFDVDFDPYDNGGDK